ncbi:hypothetical protein [Methylobacter sp.]|uniref:hypothetical protein n=1 Tax=Methylobacter sp. TaxID=2051955 RepID=UPI003DA1F134
MVQILQSQQRQPGFLESLIGSTKNKMDDYSQQQGKLAALKQEYGLKGQLEEKKQSSKFANQIKLEEHRQKYLDKLLGENKSTPEDFENENMITSENTHSGIDFENIPEENIIRAEAMGIKGLGESKQRKIKEKNDIEKAKRQAFESDREYHSKTSEPIIKEATSILKEAPLKKGLIDQQRRDIASGQTSGLIPFLVEKTGADIYRNPESSRFKTASKQRFVESLHQLGAAGARANQFIEQQLVGAQASLGRSEEANQTVLDLEEFVDDLKAERAKIELQLADEDNAKYGYARNDIARRADKKMTEYANQRQEEMAYDIRKRHEQNMSDEDLTKEIIMGNITPDTPLTLRTARILMIKNNDDERKAQAEAKKLGFRLPNEKTYLRG